MCQSLTQNTQKSALCLTCNISTFAEPVTKALGTRIDKRNRPLQNRQAKRVISTLERDEPTLAGQASALEHPLLLGGDIWDYSSAYPKRLHRTCKWLAHPQYPPTHHALAMCVATSSLLISSQVWGVCNVVDDGCTRFRPELHREVRDFGVREVMPSP